MATTPSPSTAIVPVEKFNYEIASLNSDDVRQIIQENFGANPTISAFDLERIKIPSGGGIAWELPVFGAEPEVAKHFDGIIVATLPDQRSYWPGEFSGGNEPPHCMSRDGVTGVGDPMATGAMGQHACATCPRNVFGTARDGAGRGKACKQATAVFVLRETDALLPTLLLAPPTSAKIVRAYGLRMMNLRVNGQRISRQRVITRFSLEKAKSGDNIEYARLVLTPVGLLSPEQVELVSAYIKVMEPLFHQIDTTGAMNDAEHVESE